MWNWLVSGLASGATLLLYDGSPFVGRGSVLFDFADAERMTHFGTSAKFIDAHRQGRPQAARDAPPRARCAPSSRPARRSSPEGFDYVYANVKHDVCLSSISGGTDIVSCFVLGNPMRPGVARRDPVRRAWAWRSRCSTSRAAPVAGEKGELVCTPPFPSMPLGFWNDPDGAQVPRRLLREVSRTSGATATGARSRRTAA